MIKNLSGVYEIVEYENKRSVMLYDNDQTESYPIHWHNAVEIIIPLSNDFCVISGGVEYHLKEKEILIKQDTNFSNIAIELKVKE